MRILRERETWQRPRPPKQTRGASDLTPEEQGYVRATLQVLRRRLGSWALLAEALRANGTTLKGYVGAKRKVSAGIALRAARLAGVPVEDVLAGSWPKAGACPHCGRSDNGPLTILPAPRSGT